MANNVTFHSARNKRYAIVEQLLKSPRCDPSARPRPMLLDRQGEEPAAHVPVARHGGGRAGLPGGQAPDGLRLCHPFAAFGRRQARYGGGAKLGCRRCQSWPPPLPSSRAPASRRAVTTAATTTTTMLATATATASAPAAPGSRRRTAASIAKVSYQVDLTLVKGLRGSQTFICPSAPLLSSHMHR